MKTHPATVATAAHSEHEITPELHAIVHATNQSKKSQAKAVELTERQKEIKGKRYPETFDLDTEADESFLVTINRESLADAAAGKAALPFRVFTRNKDGSTSHVGNFGSVEMHGPSWMVAFQTSMKICGLNEPNILALETTSPITVRI